MIVELKKNGRSPSYVNTIITALNSFIRFCQLQKTPQEDFTDKLNKLRPKEDRTPDVNDLFSVEEIRAILSTPNRTGREKTKYAQNDEKYLLMFNLIYKLAARSGEVIKLKKSDISLHNHCLTFYRTKTGDNRVVPIPPDMEDTIDTHISPLRDNEFLFRGYTHQKESCINQVVANRVFAGWCKRAGIKRRVHLHQLRHSSITHMLVNGAPISVVQALCGHRRLATTQLYTHVITENMRKAILLYNPLVRQGLTYKAIKEKIEEFVASLKLEDNATVAVEITKSLHSFAFQVRELAVFIFFYAIMNSWNGFWDLTYYSALSSLFG